MIKIKYIASYIVSLDYILSIIYTKEPTFFKNTCEIMRTACEKLLQTVHTAIYPPGYL